MQRQVCRSCGGTGKCTTCDGAGVYKPQQRPTGGAADSASLCASCFGSGKCPDCRGVESIKDAAAHAH